MNSSFEWAILMLMGIIESGKEPERTVLPKAGYVGRLSYRLPINSGNRGRVKDKGINRRRPHLRRKHCA